MGVPSGMVVGQPISAADVRYIYESLTSYTEDININSIYVNNFSLSGDITNPIYFYSINIIDTTPSSILTVSNSYDIDNVFIAYSLNASASYEGHVKKISWKDNITLINYSGIAICLRKGTSSYKWIEIFRSVL